MRTDKVIVEKWNPNWSDEFRKIVASLGKELLEKVISVEHVGSTSVRGLSAKPCIDLDIVIEQSSFMEVKKILEEKGYIHEGNLGIEGREAFAYQNKPELMLHHLYVCPQDSPELYRHITFRNYLRQHPELVKEYSLVKEEAAMLYPTDIDQYIAYKSGCIEKIYKECGLE